MLSVDKVQRSRLILATSGAIPCEGETESLVSKVKRRIVSYAAQKIGDLPQNLADLPEYDSIEGHLSTISFSVGDHSI